MSGVYIHIPFCRALCSYCNFYFTLAEGQKDRMAAALLLELEKRAAFLSEDAPTTLYIGGGTPSLYSTDVLATFVEKVRELWGVSNFEEFTVEVNPEDLSLDYLLRLKDLGCNRLSIGVQSFNDDILRYMNRRHNSRGAISAVEMAQKCGFDNISLDIIYGVEGQSNEILLSDLSQAISLGATHLSAYHLTIEKGSVLYNRQKRGLLSPVDESVSETHFNLVHTMLTDSGFNHYEVSNFAKEGFEALHNGNYWRGLPYLGVGPSAHSYNGVDKRVWNVASNTIYMSQIEQGGSYSDFELLSQEDRYNEYIMVSLRTAKGVSLSYVASNFGTVREAELQKGCAKFVKSGDMLLVGDRLAIVPSSFLMSDFIIAELFC